MNVDDDEWVGWEEWEIIILVMYFWKRFCFCCLIGEALRRIVEGDNITTTILGEICLSVLHFGFLFMKVVVLV